MTIKKQYICPCGKEKAHDQQECVEYEKMMKEMACWTVQEHINRCVKCFEKFK